MSHSLPVVKPVHLIRTLKRNGFYIDHQRGSHIYLKHPDRTGLVCVPNHNRDIKKGTLHSILKQADMTIEDLIDLL